MPFAASFTFRLVAPATLAGLFFVALPGCDQDKAELAPASAEVVVSRPDALVQATADIRNGRTAEAQARLEQFIEQDAKSVFRPEAEYLLGQALAGQSRFDEGKKHLDLAIDGTHDRTLKALAMLGRADCNMALEKFQLASRQYHWLESMYRDVKALPQDEVMFKLGLSCKKAGFPETADYWFKQVIELYATSKFAADARANHTKFTPTEPDVAPRVYTLQFDTYTTEEKANAEAETLRAKGYKDVQVLSTTHNGLPVYEVHIGKYGNRNDALQAKTDADLAGIPARIRPAIIEPLK